MEGIQGGASRWRSLKERLGFKGMGCCGASWSFKASDMAVRESDDEEVEEEGGDQDRVQAMEMAEETEFLDPGCMNQDNPPAAAAGMNLATALAAERHLRAAQDLDGTTTSDFAPETTPAVTATTATTPGTPLTLRVSLMKLLEEEGEGLEGVAVNGEKEGEGGGGSDGMCCVCMGRRKGAAFIPCGHTFCRVCSREIWLNRGSCPLCNRSILEILDIF